MKVSPSILASDFSKLSDEIKRIETADMVHLDIMDGHFVPNISFGADVVKSLRDKTNLIFDLHLMISNPIKYIKNFADAGADIITFHIESNSDILETIKEIRYYGKKVGIALKPKTNVKEIYGYLKYIDLALIMTVEPGFGGQKFIPEQLEKSLFIKNMSKNPNLLIEIDGGVNFETINLAKRYPIDICVSGTCIFKNPNAEEAILALK